MGKQMNFMQIAIPVFVASRVPFYLNVLKYYYSAKCLPTISQRPTVRMCIISLTTCAHLVLAIFLHSFSLCALRCATCATFSNSQCNYID